MKHVEVLRQRAQDRTPIETMREVGLGYVKLGRTSTTLSGGEAQRASWLPSCPNARPARPSYILDEPTTGLHVADVHRLVDVLQKLVDAGNTVVVIEHNLTLSKRRTISLDLGPEGRRWRRPTGRFRHAGGGCTAQGFVYRTVSRTDSRPHETAENANNKTANQSGHSDRRRSACSLP